MVEQNPSYCYQPANESFVDCSDFCSGYTHEVCADDESSCWCQMLKNPDLCGACESEEGCGGCDMDCGGIMMYAFMHFGLMACEGDQQPEPTCVQLPPPEHPIWSSPVMNNKKPRECNMLH